MCLPSTPSLLLLSITLLLLLLLLVVVVVEMEQQCVRFQPTPTETSSHCVKVMTFCVCCSDCKQQVVLHPHRMTLSMRCFYSMFSSSALLTGYDSSHNRESWWCQKSFHAYNLEGQIIIIICCISLFFVECRDCMACICLSNWVWPCFPLTSSSEVPISSPDASKEMRRLHCSGSCILHASWHELTACKWDASFRVRWNWKIISKKYDVRYKNKRWLAKP